MSGRFGPLAPRRPGSVLAAAALVVALGTPLASDAGTRKGALGELPEQWRVWIEDEVYPLISRDQREAFLALETEAQRREFAERLWVLWGRQSRLGASFRYVYEDRLEQCRQEFESTTEDRARVLLIHGPPELHERIRCEEIFNPLEIWGWSYIEGLGQGVVVLFYQPNGLGPFRLWNPVESRQVLYTFIAWEEKLSTRSSRILDQPEMRCFDGDGILRLIASAEYWLRDADTLQAMSHLPVEERAGSESASSRFMEFSALLPDGAQPLEFTVREAPRGVRGGKVRMGFSIRVPSEELGRTKVGDVDVVQLDVVGEISRDAEMVDRFRYLFTVPSARAELGLMLERFLRPGKYELRLKVEDAHSRRASVNEKSFRARPPTAEDLEVLRPEGMPPVTGRLPKAEATAEDAEEENPPLLLVGPSGEAVSGIQRFEAVAQREVARVVFLLDGREVLAKNRPPFDVDLDLGPLPRLTTVTAIGYDIDGNEIDRRQLSVNVGRERFFVRLEPLSPAETEGSLVKVAAEVHTPTNLDLERLELYWNDMLLSTLFQEPLEAWVDLGPRDGFGYLRAVAVLEDGSQAEDVQFVNAPEFGSVIEVTAVELPVVVLDPAGQPVEDIAPQEFEVFEDGVRQTLSHVSLHRDLPVRLGIVVDTSGSMEPTLPDVQRVVMGFLRDLLRPRDRAFIETFSDRPEVLAAFTADFGTLENALLALYADRSTALFDAAIMGLFQFSGVRGRRAMVVLTDGEDNASKYTYEEALDYAHRVGVPIYVVGIDLPASKVRVRWQLRHLAEVTGGRAFFIAREAPLDSVYATINRELRTQYLLAYTSSSERPRDEFREVRVEVARPRVQVRTSAGYYPGGL